MKAKEFSLTPMGGVEEIGSNMALLETPQEQIVIDCGLLFPYEDFFDINYLIPNFDLIDPEKLTTLFITHGHEDHIGGIVHFLRRFPNVKVYASPFALKLIRHKTDFEKINFQYEVVSTSQGYDFKDLTIDPVHVTHSIPETMGLIIKSKISDWGLLYLSDFKVDLNPHREKPFDLEKIKTLLSQKKNTAYFLDSTNILTEKKTPSETTLTPSFNELLDRSHPRIFVTLFASNVHRLSEIIELAQTKKRRIVLMGRSIRNYLDLAFEAKISSFNPEDALFADQVKNTDENLLVIVSGCQGDFLSALRRFSFGEDTHLKPRETDLFIFSSKAIPGNEKKIGRIYNKLTEAGVEIITASEMSLHTSGHPGKEDLRLILKNFTPTYYFPIHGESYFLQKHYEFVKNEFVTVKNKVIHNYDRVIFKDSDIKVEKLEKKEPLLIHGNGIEIEKSQISQRRKLATQGVIFVSLLKSNQTVIISCLGLPIFIDALIPEVTKKLTHHYHQHLLGRDDEYVTQQLKTSLRQQLVPKLGYKPIVEVHLV